MIQDLLASAKLKIKFNYTHTQIINYFIKRAINTIYKNLRSCTFRILL